MRIYENEGRKYLSVTTILDMMYGFDNEGFTTWALSQNINPKWITEHSASLGTKYHAYFENRFYGISEWADVLEDGDEGYKKSVEDFYAKGWEIVESEKVVYCDEFRFAGRLDMVIKNKGLGTERALADVKTWGAWSGKNYKRSSSKLKKVSDQLSMYRYALGEDIPMYLIVPQKNGECIIEGIKPSKRWKKYIKENLEKILDMTN